MCDFAAGFEDVDLASDFVFQRFADEAEGIHVLDFGLGAEFFLAARAHADVGVTAQRTFLHVAVADAGVEDDFFQAGQVFVGFVGRGEVGLADDFDQRDAGAVEIDGGGFARASEPSEVAEAFVQAFAGVFFEVNAGDADFFVLFSVSLGFRPG